MTANFKNRTLWTGDNLDIMRGLNSESVDLIYLDPPFNSNQDYSAPIGSEAAGAAFKDTWTLNDVDLAWHGLIAEEHPGLYRIIDAAGVAHGKGMKSYLIMMAVRLLEMRRILKSTGSIYLHCDPTASHYLKQLMDAVFGVGNYRNEITWKRRYGTFSTVHESNKFGVATDTILFYAKSNRTQLVPQYSMDDPQYQAYVDRTFKYVDENGRRYGIDNLANPALRPNLIYEYKGYPPPSKGWAVTKEKMEQWDSEGRLHFPKSPTGRIRRKRFLDELKGKPVQNLWDDIRMVSSQAEERTGYPTQKPLALLERIIKASSNEGDVVLDPFCGCATALIAAEKLEREWIGIDISPAAQRLVKSRMERELGLFGLQTVYRDDIPQRTDMGKLPSPQTHKHTLYGQQEGVCNGCKIMFPFKNMTIDHVVPQSKG
ncbi:MAG: DNA methyltransferase, partial [Chloroflexota bacterium]|nr:DNA methyltransferase [Chloroflexota bacterium]